MTCPNGLIQGTDCHECEHSDGGCYYGDEMKECKDCKYKNTKGDAICFVCMENKGEIPKTNEVGL